MFSVFAKTIDQATIQILNDRHGFNITEHKLYKSNGDVFRTESDVDYSEFISDVKRLNKKLIPYKREIKIIVAWISLRDSQHEQGYIHIDNVYGWDITMLEERMKQKTEELKSKSAFINIDNIVMKCLGISFDKKN
jgi:hypothetical protein